MTDHVDQLTLYQFDRVPNFSGLTVIVKEGRLVRAFTWNDFAPPRVYFDTMTDADRLLLTKRTGLN
ncbi:MAG: hypothetical protein QM770_21710 [Tepidisphaeraceae bacterium]